MRVQRPMVRKLSKINILHGLVLLSSTRRDKHQRTGENSIYVKKGNQLTPGKAWRETSCGRNGQSSAQVLMPEKYSEACTLRGWYL